MSDPSVDLEKGIIGLKEEEISMTTGLKEEEKAITTGLKEEGKGVTRLKRLKFLCVKFILDVYPVVFFVMAVGGALSYYRQTHIWLPILFMSAFSIFNCWRCGKIRHGYVERNTLPSVNSDLSSALLASSKK